MSDKKANRNFAIFWLCMKFSGPRPMNLRVLRHSAHQVIYLPKFHGELNPIERVWCSAKQYTRSHCDYTIRELSSTIPASLTKLQRAQSRASITASASTSSTRKACLKRPWKKRSAYTSPPGVFPLETK